MVGKLKISTMNKNNEKEAKTMGKNNEKEAKTWVK